MVRLDGIYYDTESIRADIGTKNFSDIDDYRYDEIICRSLINGQFEQAARQLLESPDNITMSSVRQHAEHMGHRIDCQIILKLQGYAQSLYQQEPS